MTQTLAACDRPQYGRVGQEAFMSERTVTIEINQQQEQMLDRLVAEGTHGDSHGEVVRSGFVRFCEAHPELLRPEEGSNE
jgi:hypothetical protein